MFEAEYIVRRIDGDYAVLLPVEGGEENPVARALLPEDIEEGDRLLCRDFVYERIA